MTRNEVMSFFLTAMVVLAIAVAPVAAVHASQPSQLAHTVQEGSRSLSVGAGMPALPITLACDGCSGGGNGPT
jgi:carbon starvation protein CstA